MYDPFWIASALYGNTGRPALLQNSVSSSEMPSAPSMIPSEYYAASFARFLPVGSVRISRSFSVTLLKSIFSFRSSGNVSGASL